MKAAELRANLLGERDAHHTALFLTNEYLPAIVTTLNEVGTRRRMALYGGDRVPENERNLTDVRNRMSLLIEYKLGWVGNDLLKIKGIDDVFWSNVVANRFPDLEIRDNRGNRGLRIEVKCLEAIAEEKAANFDTLKKDLNPRTDFVVVFLWEWLTDKATVGWDRAPKILRAFVFHASSLAELRDYKWLNNPPNDIGGGFQGFDLRYALNCRNGVYNEEEGNYGKLLRIWNSETDYSPELEGLLKATAEDYLEFEDFVVWSGFEVLANDILCRLDRAGPTAIVRKGRVIGFRNDETALIFKRRVVSPAEQQELARAEGVKQLVVMNDKYQWWHHTVTNRDLTRTAQGNKPKKLITRLTEN